MSAEQNKSILRRWVENGWNGGDLSLVDQVIAPNYVMHDAYAPQPVAGTAGFRKYVESYRAAFPTDFHMTIDSLVAEGDRITWRITTSGTQTGPLGDFPATGKKAAVTAVIESRFANSQFVEDWVFIDMFSMLKQLGAIPETI